MEDSSESKASDQELVAEPEESQNIIWSSKFTRKKRQRKDTLVVKKGLTNNSKNITSFWDAFNLFMSTEIKELAVRYTNKKGIYKVQKHREKGIKVKDW